MGKIQASDDLIVGIPGAIIADKRLTLAELGLWVIIKATPVGTKLSISKIFSEHLTTHYVVKGLLESLEAKGFLKRSKQGKGGDWTLRSIPDNHTVDLEFDEPPEHEVAAATS